MNIEATGQELQDPKAELPQRANRRDRSKHIQRLRALFPCFSHTHRQRPNFQVGLLSSMPGVTGLLLAMLVGRFLQTRRDLVPWYSLSRLWSFFVIP